MSVNHREPLPIGAELVEDYRIDSVLGQGGFGVTYLAEQLRLGIHVAVKEYFATDVATRDQTLTVHPLSGAHGELFEWGKQRFLEEARTLAQFRHPSIVRVLHVFEALNTAYMVLEFEAGDSLLDWLDTLERAPTQDELDRLLPPLLEALQILHEHNLIHRDIAPDNIIVRPDNTPVLLDFGAARQAFAAESKTLTSIVKAGYSPPEQYQSNQNAQGPWTDVYALGATLYRAITGVAPDAAPARQLGDIFVPSGQAAKGEYRPGFLAAIDQSLRLEPDLRPQTLAQFHSALLADGAATTTPGPGSAPGRRQSAEYETHLVHKSAVPTKPKRSILRRALATGLLLTTAIGGYLVYASWSGEQDRKAREAERIQLALLKEKRDRKRTADRAAAAAARKLAAAERRAREKRNAEAERRAALVRAGRIFRDCHNCPEMVVVPAGRFLMGSPGDEIDRSKDEGPRHSVRIAKPFAVGRYEVTRDEFAAFLKATQHGLINKCWTLERGKYQFRKRRSLLRPGFEQDGSHPVTCVNWADAKAYVAWLSQKTGQTYRLPSEAEWEYAARAGTSRPFWWGGLISPDEANYNAKFVYNGGSKGLYRRKTLPVHSLHANAWKLHNVHGNVWEWVEDCWNNSYAGAPNDGSAWTDGKCTSRVLRGGAWANFPRLLRAASRFNYSLRTRSSIVGFRVVRRLNL